MMETYTLIYIHMYMCFLVSCFCMYAYMQKHMCKYMHTYIYIYKLFCMKMQNTCLVKEPAFQP